MTISNAVKGKISSTFWGIMIGVASSGIYDLLRVIGLVTFPKHVLPAIPYVYLALVGVAGTFVGRHLAQKPIPDTASEDSLLSSLIPPRVPPSTVFVLEVSGSQPLDASTCDWRFFLTNCTNRLLRQVELSSIRSDLGVYVLGFRDIPVMKPGEKLQVFHDLWSRRMADKDARRVPSLWEFANDITGDGRSEYIWYKIHIHYREAESEAIRDGDFVFICFDRPARKLKTEGAEYFLNNKLSGWEL